MPRVLILKVEALTEVRIQQVHVLGHSEEQPDVTEEDVFEKESDEGVNVVQEELLIAVIRVHKEELELVDDVEGARDERDLNRYDQEHCLKPSSNL